jgi:hypothetical protein
LKERGIKGVRSINNLLPLGGYENAMRCKVDKQEQLNTEQRAKSIMNVNKEGGTSLTSLE